MKNSTTEKQDIAVRLSGYAAAAGAILALAPSANAQVQWSGIQDTVINNWGDTISLDIDKDAAFDFKFILDGTQSYTGGWYNSSYSYGYYYYRYAQGYVINPAMYSYQNSWAQKYSTWGVPRGFNAGDTINEALPYWNNVSYATNYGMLGYGSVYYFKSYYSNYVIPYRSGGDFVGNDAFLGVRFYIGTEQHYGWVRINMSTDFDEMTVRDWAYENLPDSGIIAGGVSPAFVNELFYNTDTVQVALNFPLPIQNLAKSDFIVSNAVVTDIVEDIPGVKYLIELAANDDGEVSLTLPQDSVDNTEGLVVLAKSTNFIVDTHSPVAAIDAGVTSTSNKKVTVTVSFNEAISGLSLDDFIVINGSKSNLDVVTAGTEYTFDVTADNAGEVNIILQANSVTDQAGNQNELASDSYTYNGPTDVADLTADNIAIYPNPAKSILYIKLNAIANIEIVNISGETIFVKENFRDEEIDVSEFEAGVYVVQIRCNGSIIHKKLIVEK